MSDGQQTQQQPVTGSDLCNQALSELRGYLERQADAVWSQYFGDPVDTGQPDKP